MILTVTLNPAIDATITLDTLNPGQVHRARGITLHAGGKGVNAASCLADWGAAVTATGLLGAANATAFETLFTAKHITDAFCRIPGETRQNIKLSHGGNTTDINLPGLTISAPDLAVFKATLYSLATPGSLVLLGGSVPAGIPDAIYAELIEALGDACRVILDTSGAPLAAALAAGKLPFCIKPNRAELEDFCGNNLPDQDSVVAAANELVARGVGLVVVSMGADGAVFVASDTVILAQPARVLTPVSTVGAGDAMVAGILAALSEDAPPERLARLATAFATGKLSQPGPNLPPKPALEEQAAATTINFLKGDLQKCTK
jgi:1-phosphofructokinase